MKKLITIISISVVLLSNAHAQTKVTKDAQGNYVISKRSDTTANKATGKVLIDSEGIKHPVYISSRGKLYWLRTAKKSGNQYKCYITV
jgi:hypothetical protein